MYRNPFEVTKAVDFSDDEIEHTFVEYPGGGFHAIANPASAMPQFLVSGKGGGRTHLMRYYSYPLQRDRAAARDRSVLDEIKRDGYIGVYFRCSGLNGSRFEGKGYGDEAWLTLFSYYMDLWLVEQLLNALCDLERECRTWTAEDTAGFADSVAGLLWLDIEQRPSESQQQLDTLPALNADVKSLRGELDRAINAAAFRRELDVQIRTVPGDLIFRAAKAAAKLPGLGGTRFTFLIDEFENLNESQQVYVNTLIREKELPTSFLIGSRIAGVRTHRTLSAGEINKKGSEYEWIALEDAYIQEPEHYAEFCAELAISRLRRAGVDVPDRERLRACFTQSTDDRFNTRSLLNALKKYSPPDRPYLVAVKKSVARHTQDAALAEEVVAVLSDPENPLLERMGVHRFYQSWRRHSRVAIEDAVHAREFFDPLRGGASDPKVTNFFGLWKLDLTASIYRECDQKVPYDGLQQFIELSGLLPRSFLTVLKYVAEVSNFRDENPFAETSSISIEAQTEGVRKASRWFSVDAPPPGRSGSDCGLAMRRLGSFLERLRYSDKPSEVQCVAFSTDYRGFEPGAQKVLDTCVENRLLLEVRNGRSARNSGSKLRKFQLHPMLSPLNELPTSRRGEVVLTVNEVNAIFNPSASEEEFAAVTRQRLVGMTAPFRPGRVDAEVETLFDED